MASALENLRDKLSRAIPVEHIDIQDESHLHAGHAGARPEGNSHFRLVVVSDAFTDMSRVKRHQVIYRILHEEMQSHIHALAISALTPKEYATKHNKGAESHQN